MVPRAEQRHEVRVGASNLICLVSCLGHRGRLLVSDDRSVARRPGEAPPPSPHLTRVRNPAWTGGAVGRSGAGNPRRVRVDLAGPGGIRDLLQVLLEARDEDGRPLTDAEIGDEVAAFLLAGHRRPASVGTV